MYSSRYYWQSLGAHLPTLWETGVKFMQNNALIIQLVSLQIDVIRIIVLLTGPMLT